MTKKEIKQPTLIQHPGLGEPGRVHELSPYHDAKPVEGKLVFALAGNQNCGKTTLFNQLTGSNQHVGNFPGVTVDRKSGFIKGMVFITHELPLLYNVTDDIMVMYAGQIVEKGTADEVVLDPLHPYSRGLMGSLIVPEEGMREQKLVAIPGAPPNLKDPPSGCRFAARCKYVIPQCTKMHTIEMQELSNGREYRCIFSEEELRKAYQNG